MPEQLFSLTLFELASLNYHYWRGVRERQYNAFLTAWYPNHEEGEARPTVAEFWSLPEDAGEGKLMTNEELAEECKKAGFREPD